MHSVLILCSEKANLAVTLAGKDDKVLAFAAFYDHPSVKDVKQSEWEKWFHTVCQCSQANVRVEQMLLQMAFTFKIIQSI